MTMIAVNNFRPGFYFTGGIALLLVAIIYRPFTIVNAGERGIVMRFGKVQDITLDEGIHPIIPIVTSVKKISIQVHKNDFNADAASRDLQQLSADLSINWHIDPAQLNKIFERVGDENQIVNAIITPAVPEILKAATAKKTAEEIITRRTELKEEIDRNLKTRLAAYGIIVDDLSLVNFSFSPEFTKAIEQKQIAEQEAEQAEFIALKATKEAQAEVNRAKGQAEAQRLKRQTLTAELLQQEAIEKWDGHLPNVMSGNGTLPLIGINSTNLTGQQQEK